MKGKGRSDGNDVLYHRSWELHTKIRRSDPNGLGGGLSAWFIILVAHLRPEEERRP